MCQIASITAPNPTVAGATRRKAIGSNGDLDPSPITAESSHDMPNMIGKYSATERRERRSEYQPRRSSNIQACQRWSRRPSNQKYRSSVHVGGRVRQRSAHPASTRSTSSRRPTPSPPPAARTSATVPMISSVRAARKRFGNARSARARRRSAFMWPPAGAPVQHAPAVRADRGRRAVCAARGR